MLNKERTNIEIIEVEQMPKCMSQSHGVLHDDRAISVHAQLQWHNRRFGTTFRKIHPVAKCATKIEFENQ